MTGRREDQPSIPWLDEREPHEDAVSRAQIDGLLRRFAGSPKRILDLGCGHGRLVVPLAGAGHEIVGLDHDAAARRAPCRVA